MENKIILIISQILNMEVSLVIEKKNKLAFNETPEWDSLAHLSIMTELEDQFDLDLEIDDMEKLTTIPKILASLPG